MEIYCLRHVRASYSTTKRAKETTSIPPDSYMSAALAADKLPADLNLIFSSPITRARDTAKIIADKKGLQVDTTSLLREIDRPAFIHGASYENEDHIEYMIQRKKAISSCDLRWRYDEASESFGQLKLRVTQLKNWSKNKYSGKKIVFVSHSNILSMLVTVIRLGENTSDKELFRGFRGSFLDYGGLAVIRYKEDTDTWSLSSIEKQKPR